MVDAAELSNHLSVQSAHWHSRRSGNRTKGQLTYGASSASASLPSFPQLRPQETLLHDCVPSKRLSYSHSEQSSAFLPRKLWQRSPTTGATSTSSGMMEDTVMSNTSVLATFIDSASTTTTTVVDIAAPNGRSRRRSILKSLFSSANNTTSSLASSSAGTSGNSNGSHTPNSMQHGIIPLRNLGLHQGAATGNVGLVKFALELGQPVNSVLNGVLPIHVACCSNSVQTVQMLLDHGADVNARRYPRKYSGDRVILPAKVNANGSTALHFAAANGNLAIVKLLLSRNANWNLRDGSGQTPLTAALLRGHPHVVKLIRAFEQEGEYALVDTSDSPQILPPTITILTRNSYSLNANLTSGGSLATNEYETMSLHSKCPPISEDEVEEIIAHPPITPLPRSSSLRSTNESLGTSLSTYSTADTHSSVKNTQQQAEKPLAGDNKSPSLAARFLIGTLAAGFGKTMRRWSVPNGEIGVASSPTSTNETDLSTTPSPHSTHQHLSQWNKEETQSGLLSVLNASTNNRENNVSHAADAPDIRLTQSMPPSPTTIKMPLSTLGRRSDTDPTPDRPVTPKRIPSKLSNSMLASAMQSAADKENLASDAASLSLSTDAKSIMSGASICSSNSGLTPGWRQRFSTTVLQSRRRSDTDPSETRRSLLPGLLFRRY